LVNKKGRLRWSGHVELMADADWMKCCVMTVVDDRGRFGGTVSRRI